MATATVTADHGAPESAQGSAREWPRGHAASSPATDHEEEEHHVHDHTTTTDSPRPLTASTPAAVDADNDGDDDNARDWLAQAFSQTPLAVDAHVHPRVDGSVADVADGDAAAAVDVDAAAVSVDAKESAQFPPDAAAAEDDANGHDAGMAAFREETRRLEALLASTCARDASHVLSGIRAWASRPAATPEDSPRMEISVPTSIPFMAPSSRQCVDHGHSHDHSHGVVAFEDGIYRGHVQPRADSTHGIDGGDPLLPQQDMLMLPHGYGIVTAHDGLRRIGYWRHGEQQRIGALRSALLTYDGEWLANAPSGYGLGCFSFGAIFLGSWLHGRPYGLGRLQWVVAPGHGHHHHHRAPACQDGWFHGVHCLQAVQEGDSEAGLEDALLRLLPPLLVPQEQPHRGLFLVGRLLETARLRAQRRAMDQWRGHSCDLVLRMARQRRHEGIAVSLAAHVAQEEALQREMGAQGHRQQVESAALMVSLSWARDQHERRLRLRRFHTDRLEAAGFQHTLAQQNVASQQDGIDLMERELGDVTALVHEATLAQRECQQLVHRLQLVKRQIENTSVTVNALQQQLRLLTAGDEQARQPQTLTPLTPKLPQRPLQDKDMPGSSRSSRTSGGGGGAVSVVVDRTLDQAHREETAAYVCDEPGCTCGIPRDVFLRVASVLNGDAH